MPRSAQKVSDSSILQFHGAAGAPLVAGALSFPLNPNGLSFLSTRILAEADSWAYFRVRSFEFRLHHGAIAADIAAGFVGGIQDTVPATTPAVCELIPSVYYGSTYTQPSDWVRVSKKELAGCFPWYKAIQGTADATEEAPGSICLAGTTTSTSILEVRGVVEFKTAVGTGNTPAQLKLREELRLERKREEQQIARRALLRVLAPAGAAATV